MTQTVWCQWSDIAVPSGWTITNADLDAMSPEQLAQISIYVPRYMAGVKALSYMEKMPNLQLLQLLMAGYDDAIAFMKDGQKLCNARGVHDASTAELAVGLAISVRRGFQDFIRAKDRQEWTNKRYNSLSDSKIAIIGFGSIGQTIAKYLGVYDVSITGYSRSGKNGSKQLSEFDADISKYDVVFLALPLNSESHKYFNAARLAKMKDGAVLINVARGPIVDTDALVKELNDRRLFAGLDVTDPEPLPTGHPLWSAPNCIIAPHVGGNSSAFESRGKRFIEGQLARLAKGEPLINKVN